MSNDRPDAIDRRPRWPWAMLGLGLVWTVLIRVPLILNAEDHLDSDLAVDGLTLLDAVNGQWRWHYPGTPYMGILPVFASYPQAMAWGANPITLVSGGTVIWIWVVVATFWLAWKAFGIEVAGWAIIPLVFSSVGTIWLSGRITGGHLLTLVWHILAFVGLHACLTRGGRIRAAALGLWCGLGVYLDAMFLFTLVGLVPASLIGWFVGDRSKSGIGQAAVFLIGLGVGLMPREIGRQIDPYDAYPAQFAATFDRSAVLGHARLLALHGLPRLIAGTGLYEFERHVVEGGSLAGEVPILSRRGGASGLPRAMEWLAILLLAGFAVAFVRLVVDAARAGEPARRAVGVGTTFSALLIVAAFLVNRNIFNSDNYRYLIYLLTPWSLGFGLLMQDLVRRGRLGRPAAFLVTGLLIEVMSSATFHWYRDTRHYLGERGVLLRSHPPPWSDLVVRGPGSGSGQGVEEPHDESRQFVVPTEVTHVFGGYWDVYRMAFLSGKQVVGIPFPIYPNRFPGWSRGLGPDQGKMLVLRPRDATSPGPRPVAEMAGGRTTVLRSAKRIDWRPALRTVWERDGRDLAEIDRLRVIVP